MEPQKLSLEAKRNLIILAVIIIVVIATGYLLFSGRHSTSKPKTTAQNSGSNSAGSSTTDATSLPAATPAANYTTVSILEDHGVTNNQIASLQTAFAAYFQKRGQDVQSVGIDESTINHVHNDASTDETDLLYFTGAFDNKTTFKAKLNYTSYSSIRLYLYDPTSGKQLYDSGDIDIAGTTGQPVEN